jgi:hypothetical protein
MRFAVVSFRERLATHEAGHVVGALTYGIPLVSVTITGLPHALCASYRPPRGLACESLLTFLLAGPEAEKEYCGAVDDGGNRIDYDHARRELARQFGPLHVGFQLARYRDAAERLVRSPWGATRIAQVSRALLARGTLSGEEIFELASSVGLT